MIKQKLKKYSSQIHKILISDAYDEGKQKTRRYQNMESFESSETNEFENQPAAPESSDAPEAQSVQDAPDTQEPETGCPYAAQARRSSPYANSP